MNNKIALIAVVVVVVLVGGFLFMRSQGGEAILQTQQETEATSPPQVEQSDNSTTSAQESLDSNAEVKEFTVSNSGFSFNPATLTVNKGDKVKITFKNTGGSHDLVIDEFNVNTKVIQTGQEDSIEFTADQVGSFEYYCSVANHRAMGMKGTLTVK